MAVIEGTVRAGLEVQRGAAAVGQVAVHGGPADARIVGGIGRRRGGGRGDGRYRHRIRRLQGGQHVVRTGQVFHIPGRLRGGVARGEALHETVFGRRLVAVAKHMGLLAGRHEMHQELRETARPGLVEHVHAGRLRQRGPDLQREVGFVFRIRGAVGKAAFRTAPDAERADKGAEREIEPVGRGGNVAQRQGRGQGQVSHAGGRVRIVGQLVETAAAGRQVGVQRTGARRHHRQPLVTARSVAIDHQRAGQHVDGLHQALRDHAAAHVLVGKTGRAVHVQCGELVAAADRFIEVGLLAGQAVQGRRALQLARIRIDTLHDVRLLRHQRRRADLAWRQWPLAVGDGFQRRDVIVHFVRQPRQRLLAVGAHGGAPRRERLQAAGQRARARLARDGIAQRQVFIHFEHLRVTSDDEAALGRPFLRGRWPHAPGIVTNRQCSRWQIPVAGALESTVQHAIQIDLHHVFRRRRGMTRPRESRRVLRLGLHVVRQCADDQRIGRLYPVCPGGTTQRQQQ